MAEGINSKKNPGWKDKKHSIHKIPIRNIRVKHLGKIICINGIIRHASEIRPQVISAKFKCPKCKKLIEVPQIVRNFKEPSKCNCGNEDDFKEISKDMVDSQVLVVEEDPRNIPRGDYPRRMTIHLKEDLTEPLFQKQIIKGAKIKVIGRLREIEIAGVERNVYTKFDLALDATNIILIKPVGII